MRPLFIVGLLLLLFECSYSQPPPTCNMPMDPISSCAAACIHCNLDGYTSITNHLDNGGTAPPGFCTFIVHHIQYVGFVAGSSSLSIQVTVNTCTFGNSIELGIYKSEDCSSYELVSNCHTAMFAGVYVFTTTTPLDIGCPYYLVIDGNLPADCPFSVRVLSGSTVAPPVTFNGGILGPKQVCQGEEHEYSVNHNGACYKQWTVTGGTITSDDMEDDVTIEFNTPGVARVCFTGENLCNPPEEICEDIIVHPNPIEINIGPFEVCEDEFYFHNGQPYGAGLHEIRHTTIFGCDSIEYLEVIEVPDYMDQLNPSVCFPDCYRRGGQVICVPGFHRLVVQSQVPPFCDTIYELNLNSIRIETQLRSSGNLSCGDTTVVLRTDSSLIAGRGFRSYRWTDEFGDEVGDDDTLIVNQSGRYCVEIIVEGPDGTVCSDMACINVVAILDDPELALDTNVAICRGDTLPLSQIPVIEVNGYSGNIRYFDGPPSTGDEIKDYLVLDDTMQLWASFNAGECED
ncbi:MAG: hypothetical protein R3275_10770, partial [Saprospiraceae bacterium]|nr:hypothetical protein [Saprospiraceae bacterium]